MQTADQPTRSVETLRFDDGTISMQRAGTGQPLVFLHAAGGAGVWTDFHGRLAQHFEVFAPDHPGFGESDELPDVDDMDDLVYHYLEVMDRYGLDRPAVVGASFGGWIAAELAVHSPERVGALALLSPAGLRIPEHPVADLFFMTPEEQVGTLFSDPAAAAGRFPAAPDVEDILRAYRDQTALARFGWSPFLANPKLERRLYRVDSPTLIVWPDDDRLIPIAHGHRYAEGIAGAELRTIESCGHALYFERPDAVADVVLDFLTTQSRSEQPR